MLPNMGMTRLEICGCQSWACKSELPGRQGAALESFRKGRGWVAALVDCRPSMADTSFLPASCTHHS